MAKPRYPLQTILDQRSRAKEDAKKAFAAALRAVDIEQQKLAEMEKEKERLVTRREEAVARIYDPDEQGLLNPTLVERRRDGVRYIERSIEEQKQAIVAQHEAVKKAEQAVEDCKSALVEADKALKAIEKHRDNWLADLKREATQKEQKLGEEIALARFVRDAAEQSEEGEE